MTELSLEFSSEPRTTDEPRILRLVVAYDGTDFRGFAVQRNQRTVAGELSVALAKVLRTTPDALDLSCAGRTDAGRARLGTGGEPARRHRAATSSPRGCCGR